MSLSLTNGAVAQTAYGSFLSGATSGGIGFFLDYTGTPSAAAGNYNFFSGAFNYFQFYSEYSSGQLRLTCILNLNGTQFPNATIVLAPNTCYYILMTHSAGAARQRLYVNGLASTMGGYSLPVVGGLTYPIGLGDNTAPAGWGFEVRDPFILTGYEPTAADAAALRDGANPSTIGAGASGRWHWTLSGTQGAPPHVGDAGLVETFGTGLPFTTLAPGTGSITYGDAMPFVPAATVSGCVATCGTAIYVSCSDLAGNWTPETGYLVEPTITCPALNGGVPYRLDPNVNPAVTIWRDSYVRGMLYSLPAGWKLAATDPVRLDLPTAAFNTQAGITGSFSGTIPNCVGRSAYGNNPDQLPRTLKWGIVVDPAGYQVYSGLPMEANYIPRADGPQGISGPGGWNIGGVTSIASNPGKVAVGWPYADHTWIDQNPLQSYPLGVWSAWWDDTGDYANHPTILKITNGVDAASERVDLRVPGTNGLGQVRYYTIAMPSDGSPLNIYVEFWQDQLAPRFANYGVYQPGDSGPPVVGAQGALMKARLPKCGAVRWVDNNQSTFCMIGPEQFAPFPAFAYWGAGGYDHTVAMSKIRPLVPANSPYTYNHLFGEMYSCTLGPSQALDAPAAGTQEQITIADASATPVVNGTGPIFPGQVLTNGSEKIRVISVDPTTGTLTTVIRGSAGTTPQAAAAGATLGVGYRKTMGTTLATYAGGSGLGWELAEYVTNGRHPFWTGCLPIYGGSGWPALRFPSGVTLAGGDYQGTAFLIATGPTSFLQIWGYGGSTPNETIAGDLATPSATLRLIMPLGEGASAPYQAQAAVVEAMGGEHWVSVPPLATDDALDAMANIYLAGTRPGGKFYLELGNEPWNTGYTTTQIYTHFDWIIGANHQQPNVFASLVAQTAHARSRWRKRFRTAGREAEISAILNLQTANMDGSLWGLTQAMNYVRDVVTPTDADAAIDIFTVAPYWDMVVPAAYQGFMLARDTESALDLTMFQLNCRSTPAAVAVGPSYATGLSPQTVFRGDYGGTTGLTTQAENWTVANAAWCAAHLPAGKVGVGIYEYGLSEFTAYWIFNDTIHNTGGIDNVATALVVGNAAQFQVGMHLMLEPATASDGDGEQAGVFWAGKSEWVLITAINTGTNTLTITRGQGNSTARAHAQGVAVTTDWNELSRDMAYHPMARILETDYLALAQKLGCSVACYHSLDFPYAGIPGGPPGVEQWGIYHGTQMLPGLGDGSDGKANNLACLARPGPGQKATNVNQDVHNVSVRGQALADWNAAVGGSSPAPAAAVLRRPGRARARGRSGMRR